MYGSCWPDIAMKNRTRTCNSLGEKLNVGMRKVRYGRTPLRSCPGCGCNLNCCPFAAAVCSCGDAEGCASADGLGAGNALICACCSGVFSPLNDGSCRK